MRHILFPAYSDGIGTSGGLVVAFAPAASGLGVRRLVPRGQAGLGRGLAPGPEGLGDRGGLHRVRQAAEAILGLLVELSGRRAVAPLVVVQVPVARGGGGLWVGRWGDVE